MIMIFKTVTLRANLRRPEWATHCCWTTFSQGRRERPKIGRIPQSKLLRIGETSRKMNRHPVQQCGLTPVGSKCKKAVALGSQQPNKAQAAQIWQHPCTTQGSSTVCQCQVCLLCAPCRASSTQWTISSWTRTVLSCLHRVSETNQQIVPWAQ